MVPALRLIVTVRYIPFLSPPDREDRPARISSMLFRQVTHGKLGQRDRASRASKFKLRHYRIVGKHLGY